MDRHPITWTAPEPLWAEAANRTTPQTGLMAAPTILRFTTDDFMQEFQNIVATDPRRLGAYRVVRETWRGVLKMEPASLPKQIFALPFQRLAATRQRINGSASADQGKPPAPVEGSATSPLKLYQPAHQRYYLVTSCLVCQIPGLPDRKVDTGKQEQIGFVMRRLLPPSPDPANPPKFDKATWNEYAWVGNSWKFADRAGELVPNEEVLPMFGFNYFQDDQRKRRLFTGLVPAGKREAYLAAATADSGAAEGTDFTARKILLRTKVIEPWKQLLDRATKAAHALEGKPNPDLPSGPADAIKQARIKLQEASYFLLLDFGEFLSTYLEPVWTALLGKTSDPDESAQKDALKALRTIRLNEPVIRTRWTELIGKSGQEIVTTLADALKQLNDHAEIAATIEATKTNYSPEDQSTPNDYPPFIFPLADPQDNYVEPTSIGAAFPQLGFFNAENDEKTELEREKDADISSDAAQTLDQLAVLLARALKTSPTSSSQPAIPLAAKPPADGLTGWFVIRCVYRRPACGPLHDDVVSDGTDPFQLAGFFDPDAPARPIRIGLPIDTSPAGLRKFDKNTAFVLSDMLCGHVKRAKGMSFGDLVMSVLPFPFHKDLGGANGSCKSGTTSLGTICSLSIPIITICAFILLIIMVSLLDLIFHWTPYFMLCFPVKGMDGKKG